MLKVKRARTVGFVAAAALLVAGIALALWPAGAVQAQDEEPPPVANLKCEARTDQVRFSWDIPRWSGGETKWYDVAVTLPNGNRFTERRHRDLRSRTYRGKWQPASEARIEVKALYDLPNGDRVTSAASEAQCVVPGTPNSAPAVTSAIADATIINESGTHEASLAGVFTDADNDDLTITASSSAEAVATALMASDQSALTVEAKSRGTATITVTAADGNGGTVDDVFTVTVKAAPVVASAIADVSGLEVGSTRDVSLTGVFSDADNDALTVTAASSDQAKATVSVAADYASLTVSGVAEGSASVTVTAQDSDGNTVDDAFDVTVNAAQQQPANNPPAVASAIADATIINESGTHQVTLTGVFTDADGDSLTVTASSSAETVATVSVSADQSALTVAAKSRGTATITVTAADGKGGKVDDVFTVTVKAAPAVASAIADVSELEVDATHQVLMSGVFSDADGDAVTVTQASSSDTSIAAVTAAIEGITAAITAVTVTGKSEGTATVTVTAQDSDGNTVSDAFDVTVPAAAVQLQQTQSSDATLSALTLSGYTVNGDSIPAFGLRPAFVSGTTEYAASAPQFTARVSVTATASDPGAAIQVDGQTVASGAPSQLILLVDNQPKKITVTVTAADGATQQTYTVAATGHPRADLRDLTLSPGELHPSIFVTSQQDYQAWTPHSVNSVRVTATRRHGSETLTVNGQAVTSGQPSPAIDLEVGENRITVVATAPDGYTSKSYTITVTRLTEAQSSDATLSGIMVYQATSFQPDNANNVPYEGDPLTIAPAISRTEREYLAEQPEANGIYVAVAVTTNAPGARSIVIDGPKVNLERRDPKDEVVSGEASGPWQMSLGYQLITITVISLDGKNTETYRLVIKRGTVDDLKGLRLSSGDGALTLSWDASDSPTAPTDYMLRWRRAGETTWLNSGFPPGWKTSYALDAGYAGPADGDRFAAVTQGSATLSGLENGTAYEVQARGARGPLNPRTGERQIFVFLRTDWQSLTGTPGAAQTTLSITPSSPTREYGGVDDLGFTVSGLKSGDAATDVLTGALSRAAGEDAGDYAIGMGTLAVASAHADKYALPAAPALTTYTITPKPITAISGVTVNARASDGTTDASFDTSAAAGTGVLPAELADFRAGGLAVSGVFPLAVPGTHDVSVTYSLQDHGSFKAANYSLTATSDTLRGELEAAPQPACTPAVNGNYDRDNDGLIEICNLDQLNAIRFDSKGCGWPERGLAYEYSLAFPGVLTHGPGCADGCRGYELVVDLDFDTNGNGKADAGDQFWNEGLGWEPMPILDRTFTGTFEGNGHTISSLYMNKPANMSRVGLFQAIGSGARVHNVTLDNIYVKGGGEHIAGLVGVNNHHASIKNSHVSGEVHSDHDVGLLVGENHGLIDASSASGTVTGNLDVGILAGENFGTITRSNASGNVSGHTAVGGLIGKQLANSTVGGSSAVAVVTGTASDGHSIGGLVGENYGHVLASMARVTVTGKAANKVGGLVGSNGSNGTVVATYAWGETRSSGNHVGGLVGVNSGVVRASYAAARVNDGGLVGLAQAGSVVDSYWDVEVSGAQSSGGGLGLTTVEMKSPTDYAGIYANWNLDLDGDGSADSPWQFSESTDSLTLASSSPEYPLLRSLPVSAYSAPGASRARPVTGISAEPSPGPRVNVVATMDFEAEGFDDAALRSLSLPQGVTMDPEFRSDHYSYELTVPDDVDRLTFAGRFNPWMKHDGSVSEAFAVLVVGDLATYEWLMNNNGNRELRARMLIANGTASGGTHTIALSPDAATVIEIGVYKTRVGHHYDIYRSEPDNWADRKVVYTLTVTRGDLSANGTLRDLTISAGSLAFDPATTAYSVDVGHAVKSVTLTPVASNPDATVTVNGADPATPVQLDYGRNVINVAVTSLDGQATSAYTVVVTRPQPAVNLVATLDLKAAGYDDAVLRSMSLPQGVTIDPAFQSGVHSYRLTVPDDMDRLTFAGRFDPMRLPGSDEAWSILVVEPGDLTQYELFLSNRGWGSGTPYDEEYANNYFDKAIVANLQHTSGVHTIALPPDAVTVIKIAVYKTRIGDRYGFAPADAETLARKTVYTLTVTRGDPSAGEAAAARRSPPPTVAAPIADLTGLAPGSTQDVSLTGVFSDADGDSLTVTAASSDDGKATVSVAADHSKLTVTGVAVGTATITVTAADGNGGTVSDSFTVTVKSAPTVAAPIADLTGLEAGATQEVSLSGVFSDADGDSLTVTAASSDDARATVSVASDHSKLTVTGVAVGTVTVTVTAADGNGNRVSDAFEVVVVRKYAALIAQMYEWRNDPQWVSERAHTDRWDRALLAFGETVADVSLTAMTASEAQQFANRGWERWNPVAEALAEIEAGGSG